jgi:hypothetical protein
MAAEKMYAEIKAPMNLNKTAEFGARRNNHLYGIITSQKLIYLVVSKVWTIGIKTNLYKKGT